MKKYLSEEIDVKSLRDYLHKKADSTLEGVVEAFGNRYGEVKTMHYSREIKIKDFVDLVFDTEKVRPGYVIEILKDEAQYGMGKVKLLVTEVGKKHLLGVFVDDDEILVEHGFEVSDIVKGDVKFEVVRREL